MKRLICIGLGFSLSMLVSSCDLLRGALPQNGGDLVNAGINAGKAGIEARDKAKAQCEPLGDFANIGVEEEKNTGGAIAIGLVMKSGGLKIDLPNEIRHLANPDVKNKLRNDATYPIPETANNRLNHSIALIGRHLAQFSDRKDLTWNFKVLKNDSVNAYSTPGGYVLLTEGLLKKIQNQAELSCVLAHEIGHVQEKHGLKEFATVKKDQCVAAVSVDAAGKIAGSVVKIDLNVPLASQFNLNTATAKMVALLTDKFVEKVIGSGYARESELDADRKMLDLVSLAGYDRTACIELFQRLPDAAGVFPNHPKNAERVKQLVSYLHAQKGTFGYEEGKGERPPWSLESALSQK